MGTNRGRILLLSYANGELIKDIQPHDKKITHIYIKEKTALISTSHDGTLYITSLCPEFDDIPLPMQENELSCFSTRQTFNAASLEFFVGTS